MHFMSGLFHQNFITLLLFLHEDISFAQKSSGFQHGSADIRRSQIHRYSPIGIHIIFGSPGYSTPVAFFDVRFNSTK
eukprot:12834.XXX_823755_823985_1 [CDS] Oithona nana genome sequencing.